MTLDIIGAGFGRTGTESMRIALEHLGFGPCHHGYGVYQHPQLLAYWEAAVAGEWLDWDRVFDGFRATVDWPAAAYWRDLADYYPNAKVLLTTRDAESWWSSISETIFRFFREDPFSDDPYWRRHEEMVRLTIEEREFGGDTVNRDHVIEVFEAHNASVEATIPEGRRLTFHLGDGWEPLCTWLGVPVPDLPFPCTNAKAEFPQRVLGSKTLPE